MPTTHAPSLVQLRQAIEIQEKIQKLEAELQAIIGSGGEIPTPFSKALFGWDTMAWRFCLTFLCQILGVRNTIPFAQSLEMGYCE
jgi:hypothetical protein